MTIATTPMAQSRWERLRALAQRLPDQVAIFTMALVGIAVSLYLTAEHYAQIPLLCATNGVIDCSSVLKSAYAVVPGTAIPITIPGVLWFGVSGGLALWGLLALWRDQREPTWLRSTQQGWGVIGLLSVLYLVSAEIDHLHRICAWCTVVHLLVLVTLLVSLYFRPIPKYDRARVGATKAPRVQPATAPLAPAAVVVPTPTRSVPPKAHAQDTTARQSRKAAATRSKATK